MTVFGMFLSLSIAVCHTTMKESYSDVLKKKTNNNKALFLWVPVRANGEVFYK